LTDATQEVQPGETALFHVAPGSIVVGHDGSPHSDIALGEALDLAQRLDVAVTVVRTWSIDTAPAGSIVKDGYVASYREISATVRAELEKQAAPLARSHPTVTIDYFGILGRPADVLIHLSHDALMLVIGRRGLGGFAGLLVGSVSTHCVHRASCPTLVVPPRS
jgi:nucleotide-binding universal stress UspA family protein